MQRVFQLALQMREQHQQPTRQSSDQSLVQQRRMLLSQTVLGQLVTTREGRLLLLLLLLMPASPLWMATQTTQATPQETTLGTEVGCTNHICFMFVSPTDNTVSQGMHAHHT